MWEGVTVHQPYAPPAPHEYQRTTVGSDPHKALHHTPAHNLTTAQIIERMIKG
jgi:hypothetical protein